MFVIPSSLVSPSTEYFTLNGVRYKTSSGTTVPIQSLPAPFYKLLLNEIQLDQKAQKGLNILRISEEKQQVEKHYECNYSTFDGASDLSDCGTKLGPMEYVPCAKRAVCKAHGLLCRIPADLTARQAEIAVRIAKEQMDAQICSELFITQDTLRTHKNGIERKIGRTGKVAIGVWATQNKLI